jgi:ubiquinone/menaquinone biosynthesis C-methylase UbiE
LSPTPTGQQTTKEELKMTTPMSGLGFRLMCLAFKVRDQLSPRSRVLAEAGVRPGYAVLDFGCGPGSYLEPLLAIVGPWGRAHALDAHPLAIAEVNKLFGNQRRGNVQVIESDCATGLPSQCIDTALLYDVFHLLHRPGAVLEELHRVLKTGGMLSFSDHHMREADILAQVTGGGLFRLVGKGRKTYSFAKVA